MVQLVEYNECIKALEYLKEQNIEDTERFYIASHVDENALSEVILKRMLFEGNIVIYSKKQNNIITHICVLSCPGISEKYTAPIIILCSICDIEFMREVLLSIKNDFIYKKWTKVEIIPLRCQLKKELIEFLEKLVFKKELELKAADKELNMNIYSYFL